MQQDLFTQGQTVAFKLKDAVCPRLGDALAAIGPDLEVLGEIVFFSDGGEKRRHYAVIEVGGIHTPLIVPVERLADAAGRASDASRDSAGEFRPVPSRHPVPALQGEVEPSRQVG